MVVGGAGLACAYVALDGNLSSVDIDAKLGADRPDDVDDGSQDILVLGSDSRSGDNGKYGRDEGAARSDTAMVLHVDKGHKSASVVSIPRDTLIERPACESDTTGDEVPAEHRAMFNTAYEVGGPACAVKTVESMSGIRMDHYLEVDFTGFKKLIDELGGVEVTTKTAIDDSKSHLDLEPGTHTLNGEESLGLVRTRKSVGDGSDLGRIQLQQAFIKALIDQTRSVGVFSSPKKLYGLADAATKAVTTDSGLGSVKKLTGFANGLRGARRRRRPHGDPARRVRPGRPEPGAAAGGGGPPGLGRPPAGPADPRRRHRGLRGRQGRRLPGRAVAHRSPPVPAPGAGIPDARPRFWEIRPVLADWYVGPGSRPRTSAWTTRRPPETRRHLEARHSPRVRRDPGQLHLRCVVHHPEHHRQRHHPCRRLLRVPPVLHGQAEDPRHRRPRGPLRGPLRQG